MSDVLDAAQAVEERERHASIARVRSAACLPPASDGDCIDCGDEIDPDRRRVLPGARRCLTCAEARERRERGL
ncbi:MAG: TraR/DksA C4-type zinc finger protein [Caulobacter sp.]